MGKWILFKVERCQKYRLYQKMLQTNSDVKGTDFLRSNFLKPGSLIEVLDKIQGSDQNFHLFLRTTGHCNI